MHQPQRLHRREPDQIVARARQPQQRWTGFRVADVAQRLGDLGVGPVGDARRLIASGPDGGVDRVEERLDLGRPADVLQGERRILLDQRVLELRGDPRRRLPGLELAQLLDGLDADLGVAVLQLFEPGLRIGWVRSLAAGEREGDGECEMAHVGEALQRRGRIVNKC